MRKGSHHTQETKNKCRDAALGRKPWNKGLTKETDSRIVEYSNKCGRKGHDLGHPNYYSREYMGDKFDGIEKNRIDKISKKSRAQVRVPLSQASRDKISKSKIGQKPTQESRNKMSLLMIKRWQDPEYAERVMVKILEGNQKAHPNKPEKQVLNILKALSSDIKYVGDGTHWISRTGKNPDFINEEKKQIIEVYGCYWHGCSKHYPDKKKQRQNALRIKEFKSIGYSVLIIWEHELKNTKLLTMKILKFIEENA